MTVPTLRWNTICQKGERLHIARAVAPERKHWRTHRHDFYECFVVEEGSGWHLIEGKRVRLEAGQMAFIRPEHEHGFSATAKDALAITNVALEAAAAEAFLKRHGEQLKALGCWEKGREPRVLNLTSNQQSGFVELVRQLAVGSRSGLEAEYFLCGVFHQLVSHDTATGQAWPSWLREALPYASEPDNLREGSQALYRLCGRSPEHVARAFRKYLGMTPTEWVTQSRIRFAQRLLVTTDLAITEVALECGLENLSHFHKCFRNSVRQTPLAYRKAVFSVAQGSKREEKSG